MSPSDKAKASRAKKAGKSKSPTRSAAKAAAAKTSTKKAGGAAARAAKQAVDTARTAAEPPLRGNKVRKRPGSVTTQELERWEQDEPRELAAVLANVASLRREVEIAADELRVFEFSRSWRVTAPMRAVAKLIRERTGA